MKFKDQEPFYRTNEKKSDIFTIRFNPEERKSLNECKRLLQQPKDSTCLKLLAEIGKNVLHDQKTGLILRSVFKNKQNNQCTGFNNIE